jgi:parallel beta-helix repeat protein
MKTATIKLTLLCALAPAGALSDGGGIDYATGMVCDNSTDAAPALQSAASSAAAAGHRLFLPSNATCLLKSPVNVPSNADWYGFNTILSFAPDMSLGNPIGTTPLGMTLQNISHVRWEGITFNGAGAASQNANGRVGGAGVTNWTIVNSVFQNFGNANYYVQGLASFAVTKLRIYDSTFQNNSGDGAAFSNGVHDATFRGNAFLNNGDWGLVPVTIGGDNILVDGNSFSNNRYVSVGVDRGTDVHIVNNTMQGGSHCVRITRYADSNEYNQNISVIGNHCVGAAISVESSGTTQGHVSVPGGGQFLVANNTILNSPGAGIMVADSSNGIVSSNFVYNAGADGIAEVGYNVPTGNNLIVGNRVNGATYGLRQLNAGAAILPSVYSGNTVVNASVVPASLVAVAGTTP